MLWQQRRRKLQKGERFDSQNNNSARTAHFLVRFFAVTERLRHEIGLTGIVNKRQLLFLSRSEHGYDSYELIFRGVAYVWQNKWGGIIAFSIKGRQVTFKVTFSLPSPHRRVILKSPLIFFQRSKSSLCQRPQATVTSTLSMADTLGLAISTLVERCLLYQDTQWKRLNNSRGNCRCFLGECSKYSLFLESWLYLHAKEGDVDGLIKYLTIILWNRGKYSWSHYSPRLKRIIVLVYTHEVISTKSERKPLKSTIWLTDQITRTTA